MEVTTKIISTAEEILDVVPLFDQYRQFYNQTSDIEGAKNFLLSHFYHEKSVIIAASSQHSMVGFTQLYPGFSSVSMKPLFTLNDLYVLPSARGKGVGRLLIKSAQQVAIERKWKGLILETATDNPAQKLYEKIGWTKDEEYLHYYWNC